MAAISALRNYFVSELRQSASQNLSKKDGAVKTAMFFSERFCEADWRKFRNKEAARRPPWLTDGINSRSLCTLIFSVFRADSRQNDGDNPSAPFQEFVPSGVWACIIRLDSFSVCFPPDGARWLPDFLSHLTSNPGSVGNFWKPFVCHLYTAHSVPQEHKFTFGAV